MSDEPKVPEFATAAQVAEICETMQKVENDRSKDRSLIDNLANGGKPYTPAEVEKHQIQINVNWGGLNKKTQDANRQINNATLHIGQFFSATSRRGKVEKRDEYGRKFTANLHIPLKRGQSGKQHFFLLRNRNATLVLHGLGPILWMNDYGWLGRNVALEDLLIPTDTWIDFSNLSHFAVNLYLTAGELFDMTHGDTTQKGWDKKAIQKLFDALRINIPNSDNRSWVDNPEAMVELFKQNRCAIDSDKVPRIKLRLFLFQDKESKKWFRRIILRENTGAIDTKSGFLFKSEKPFADNLTQILHVQFGDNVLNAPLKYHSVRGIGTMLYSPEECSNRMMCQYVQHVFESLMTWFRITDPVDHGRLKSIVLRQYGILEDGLNVVPQSERHQIEPKLVESVLSKFRQVMSENSSSYVQDINDGTSKERTATEVKGMLSSVNTMVSGTLQGIYLQEGYYFEEVVRRFLNKNSSDEEVKEFQKACKRDGIPDDLMVADNWLIDVEKVLGGGDRMAAQQEADALLSQSHRYDPSKQRIILRKWTVATTNDPAMGNLLVTDAPDSATDGTRAAENLFGTLMQGTPVHLVEGIDQIGYVEAMLGMLTASVERIKAGDNMGTPQDIAGFGAVAGDIQQHIALLEAEESNGERVKQYSDHLGQIMNDVKGFAQRQQQAQEAAAAESAQNPEAIAKAEATAMLAKLKAEIDAAKADQKMQQNARKEQQNAIKFQLEQARKQFDFDANLSREEMQNKQDLAHKAMENAMNLMNAANEPEKATAE